MEHNNSPPPGPVTATHLVSLSFIFAGVVSILIASEYPVLAGLVGLSNAAIVAILVVQDWLHDEPQRTREENYKQTINPERFFVDKEDIDKLDGENGGLSKQELTDSESDKLRAD